MLRKILIILILILGFQSSIAYNSVPGMGTNFCYNLSSNSVLITNSASCSGMELNSYNLGVGLNWLDTTSCDLTYNSNAKTITANWNTSHFYTQHINYLKNTYAPNAGNPSGNAILNANLWMKTQVTYKLNLPNGAHLTSPSTFPKINDTSYTVPLNPYTSTSISDYANNHTLAGTYNVTLVANPIDNKCKFNGIGITSTPILQQILSVTILDSDSDSVPDAVDLCPNKAWDTGAINVGHTATSASIYRGCPFEYSQIPANNCAGITFHKLNSKISMNAFYMKLIYAPSTKMASGFGRISYKLNQSGNYTKKSLGWTGWSQSGSCNLRKNSGISVTGSDCINGPKGYKMINGVTKRFYKYKYLLPKNKNKKYINVTCSNGKWKSHSLTPNLNKNKFVSWFAMYKKYNHPNPKIKSDAFKHLKKRGDGDVEDEDDDKKNKVHCNLDTNICKYKIPGGSQIKINLSKLSNLTTRSIKIYNQSGLIRTEKADPILIALQANHVRHFKNVNQLINFVNKSYTLTKKFDIIKNLSYDPILNISTIRISTKNFADGGRVHNLTLYQKIPKAIASTYDNISFISDGGAQRFTLDKDPIIGWYFNDTNGNVNISYNVSGNNEGGTIILTQEPILFNEGELIINYRQNKTGCNVGEVHLFDLSNLDNSKILNKNTGNYQICITHLDTNIHLSSNAGINNLNISSYNLNSNISSNFTQFTQKLLLSTSRNNIYWDLKIQEKNPNGNFSCLGSYDKVDTSSLFGDCAFKPQNRIWLHLGADNTAPITMHKIPYLSHSVQVELIAADNIGGSGLNKTSYCIISNLNDCQNLNTFNTYSTPFNVACPADWSCTRLIKYYSTDIAGNIEPMHTENLYLIDKGSACQADCTAKPAPDRYLKECRNLNGCFYAKSVGETGINIGLNVANKCNLKVSGSIVDYNSTHQITCPSGPFKLKQYTTENVNFKGTNKCKSLIKTPYTIILNGEQLVMSILTCYDY